MNGAFQNWPAPDQIIRLSGFTFCKELGWLDLQKFSLTAVFNFMSIRNLPESTYVGPTLARGDPITSLSSISDPNIHDNLWFYLRICPLITVYLTPTPHTHTHIHSLTHSLSNGSPRRAQVRFLWFTWYCQCLAVCLMRSNYSINIWEWMNSRNMFPEKLLGRSVKKTNVSKILPMEEGDI